MLGFLMGTRLSSLYNQEKRRKKKEEIHKDSEAGEKEPEKTNKQRVRVKKRMEQIIAIKSDKPIDPDKIKVKISKDQERDRASPEPNFIPLTVLWAHFVASQFGLLARDRPAPWQILDHEDEQNSGKHDIDLSQHSWQDFLSKVITDTGWTRWIQDPEEVKNRTLLAFERPQG